MSCRLKRTGKKGKKKTELQKGDGADGGFIAFLN